jgi:hypothetical protein
MLARSLHELHYKLNLLGKKTPVSFSKDRERQSMLDPRTGEIFIKMSKSRPNPEANNSISDSIIGSIRYPSVERLNTPHTPSVGELGSDQGFSGN